MLHQNQTKEFKPQKEYFNIWDFLSGFFPSYSSFLFARSNDGPRSLVSIEKVKEGLVFHVDMISEPNETRGGPLERRKRWRSSASVVDVITATWANWPNSVPADTVRLVIPSRRWKWKERDPPPPLSTLHPSVYSILYIYINLFI